MRQKFFERKSSYFPLPLIHKLIRYQKFSETQHRRVTLRKFSALWDKTIWTDNLDTPSSDPQLSFPNFFDTRNSRETKWFAYGILRHCATRNISTEKFDTPPLLIHKFMRYRKLSETQHRKVPLQSFSAL